MALVGEQAADIVGLEALQTDALGAEVGGEEPDPVLGVGMGEIARSTIQWTATRGARLRVGNRSRKKDMTGLPVLAHLG